MQIALENVARLKLDEIERDSRFLLGSSELLERRFHGAAPLSKRER
jgi:hypothetical protein